MKVKTISINEETLAPDDCLFLADEIKKEILNLNEQERATLLESWKFLFVKHIN